MNFEVSLDLLLLSLQVRNLVVEVLNVVLRFFFQSQGRVHIQALVFDVVN